jgi:hypothetical protein
MSALSGEAGLGVTGRGLLSMLGDGAHSAAPKADRARLKIPQRSNLLPDRVRYRLDGRRRRGPAAPHVDSEQFRPAPFAMTNQAGCGVRFLSGCGVRPPRKRAIGS